MKVMFIFMHLCPSLPFIGVQRGGHASGTKQKLARVGDGVYSRTDIGFPNCALLHNFSWVRNISSGGLFSLVHCRLSRGIFGMWNVEGFVVLEWIRVM